MVSTIAALIFVLTTACVGIFQLALLLGAPWGELTLGGRWAGSLPPKIRLIPFLSLWILAFLCAAVLARAGYSIAVLLPYSQQLAWVAVAYCVVGVLANAATPSKKERKLWLPVVAVMLVSSLIVATS